MKLMQNSTGSYLVVIPKDIVKMMGWKPGLELSLILDNGTLTIKVIDREVRG